MLTRPYSSLSLKSNASQDQILFELEQLKHSFKEALRVSSRSSRGSLRGRVEHNDARVSRNLHNLAAAAREFHSTASSTSGTTRAGSSNAQWQSIPPSSLVGDFPAHRRQRVEEFVQAGRYPFLEAVSTTRPSSLRTPSLSSLQHIAPAAPMGALTARDDNVVASEPTQGVSEADDDEELEEEWEYFDGLRDLARDRITKQDYTKAIEFITQAMTKTGALDETDETVMQLQAQLALCHFFKSDWRSAEPIVLRLATLALNEVTCNLLHALSLAHLFQYSLDGALRFCRKAWKGKRDLLEKDQDAIGGPMEADYGKTVALCSTIYHMKGDPIFAEVFHRRLPKGFEYKHPSSELEFIFNHPRLLPAVLGDDIPPFDVGRPDFDLLGPESCFVFGWETAPQDAQKLYRSSGVVANSPLRERFARHELHESDTDKIVVEGPSPCSPCSPADSGIDMSADDEMQPVNAAVSLDYGAWDTAYHEMPADALSASDEALTGETMIDETLGSESSSPESSSKTAGESSPVRLPLRRRVTKMFNARRPRPAAAGEMLVEPLTCPPEPPASSRVWFHNPSRLGIGRSKTVARNACGVVGSEGEPKAKARGVQRILRLCPVAVTFKRATRGGGPEAASKKTGEDELPDLEEETSSGGLAAGPPTGQSRGRLGGLTAEYHGQDASVGPYTCKDPRWPDPNHHPLAGGHMTTSPHGPGDIFAAVELEDSGPNSHSRSSNSSDNTPCSGGSVVVVGRSEPHGADQALATRDASDSGEAQRKGKQRLRLDTSVTFAQVPHDPARCRTQLPGQLARVLASLSVVAAAPPGEDNTEEKKGALGLQLARLADHVHTCLDDLTLEADLQGIIATLSGIEKASPGVAGNNGHGCDIVPRITVEGSEDPPRSSPKDPQEGGDEPLPSWEVVSTVEEPPAPDRPKRHFLTQAVDEADPTFVMADKAGGRHNVDEGDGCSAAALAPTPAAQKIPLPRPPGTTKELLPRRRSSSSGSGGERPCAAARSDLLQRAFSFVAGDDANFQQPPPPPPAGSGDVCS